jgi:tetratricopeptide (TPR) repeat protein
LVANTLHFLGYEPVWQDVFGAEEGDLRDVLRKQIDACKGVVQIVGHCYGAEPPAEDEPFGRVSYTQFEALYARQRGRRVWFLVLDDSYPTDPHEAEPEDLSKLQADYRQRVQADKHLFHPLGSRDALEANVLKMKDELSRLRRSARLWAATVTVLLVAILALVARLTVFPSDGSPSETVMVRRADAALLSKDYPAAIQTYLRLSDSSPANIRYHRRIEECARQGQMQTLFLERYTALVRQQPDNAIFNNYLGNAYLMLDPRDADGKAKERYETALRLAPDVSLPLANLGILAYRAGRTNDAQELFQRYLAAYPDDAKGWVNLGVLSTARFAADTADERHRQQAEQSFRRALELKPGTASAYKGLGRLFAAAGRKAEALKAYQRSLALDIDQPETRQQIERLASELGDEDGLAPSDDLQTRAVASGTVREPLVVAALRFLDDKRFQEAEQVCQAWITREPDNPLAHRLLACSLDGQGQTAAAGQARAAADRLFVTPHRQP